MIKRSPIARVPFISQSRRIRDYQDSSETLKNPILAPVESINKPLDEEERRYYARVTHCITALQVCVLIILFCLDLQDYFYAGYVSIVLVAGFMVIGK